jgi:cobalt/nickel transport system permease protein
MLPTRTAPKGLARLSSIWTAPVPDYAPRFMRSAMFGYMMSALLGTGLIILTFLGISWMATRRRSYQPRAA